MIRYYFKLYAAVFVLTVSFCTSVANAEPVPCDSCAGYPAGAFMRSSGPEQSGVLYRLSCQSGIWEDLDAGAVDPCAGGCNSPSPGTVCADGSIYAGISPDGNIPMFTTPADAGQFAWNDANSTGNTTTGQTSFVTGQANTSALIGLDSNSAVGGIQPHRAAQHCANLSAHGHDDWYLPSQNELNVLRLNSAAIGGFDLSGSNPAGWYWTSSEGTQTIARNQRFSDGTTGSTFKYTGMSVRCVRKGA